MHVHWQLPQVLGTASLDMVMNPFVPGPEMAVHVNFTHFLKEVVGHFGNPQRTFAMLPHHLVMRTPADTGPAAPLVLHLNFGPSKAADFEVRLRAMSTERPEA